MTHKPPIEHFFVENLTARSQTVVMKTMREAFSLVEF